MRSGRLSFFDHGVKRKSSEADELEVLSLLVEAYEKKHVELPQVDPVTLLLHVMEFHELTREALEPYIGSPTRVAAWDSGTLRHEQHSTLRTAREWRSLSRT